MTTDLIRPRGRHRRRAELQFAVIVAFWGLVVAGSGFVAGWVWAQAMS